jgi:hypothetical protein
MSLEGAESSTRRERLLEAAITLFARQDYEATSIADIQRACGHCQLEQSEGDFRRFASAIDQVACDV